MYDIVKKPVISEKSTMFAEHGAYAFYVHPRANKIMVRRAISEQFGVDVESVRMCTVRRKRVQRGKFFGWKPGGKKAIVSLQKGQKIELA
jgi:large subunit ribosomal protein L23